MVDKGSNSAYIQYILVKIQAIPVPLYCIFQLPKRGISLLTRMTTTKAFYSIIICLLLSFGGNSALAQTNPNLVPNFGFDAMVSCPVIEDNMADVDQWSKILNHLGSPDYFNTCATGNLSVPANLPGNQATHSGNGYAGFVTYYAQSAFREYITIQLSSSLRAGATYQVSARVSLADNVMFATDGLGFYFTTSEVSGNNTYGALSTISPQVSNPVGSYIGNKNGWSQISGSFTAGGGEQYLTIGNFKNDASVNILNTGTGTYDYSYLYIEDVILQEIAPLDIAGLEFQAKARNDQEVDLFWEVPSDPSISRYELERSVAVTDRFEKIDQQNSRQSISPESYALLDSDVEMGQVYYYRLKAIGTDGKENYSEVRQVSMGSQQDQITQLFPRPVDQQGEMTLELVLSEAQNLSIEIMDLSGKIVKIQESQASAGANQFQVPATGLSQGAYLLRVRGGNVPLVEKFWVKG